jgi:hypothetical protein
MTKAERSYLSTVVRLGCAICHRVFGCWTPAEIHHPRTGVGAARRAPHAEAIPLCPEHHRGATGLHGLGRKAFERRYRVTELDLVVDTQGKIVSQGGSIPS